MKNLSNLPENYISWDDSVERVGGEEDFLVELLNDLKDLVQVNLTKIKSLITENNFLEIRELAHSMKGASGNLGLNTMYESTMNLEQSAKEENKSDINKHVENLEGDFKNLKILLDS